MSHNDAQTVKAMNINERTFLVDYGTSLQSVTRSEPAVKKSSCTEYWSRLAAVFNTDRTKNEVTSVIFIGMRSSQAE